MPLFNGKCNTKLMCGGHKVAKIYCEGSVVYASGNVCTYHVDGATYQEEVDEGASCLLPTSFTIQEKSGYTFMGWSLESGGNVLANHVMGDEPIELYAVWKPANISTASIKANYLYGSTHQNFTTAIIYAWSSAAYDLTNVKSITFTLNYYYYDTSEPTNENRKYFYDAFDYYAGVSANKSGFVKYSGIEKIGYEDYATVKNATTNITLDVSGLSGNYYIGAGVRGMNKLANEILVQSHYQVGKKPAYYAMITAVSFS